MSGEDVVIAKGDKPVVRLVPIPQGKFKFGVLEPGALGDGPDFFAPMDEDELAAWEGTLLTTLLLDTHVWAWTLTNDRRISDRARREIADADTIFVSAISFFEIAQKVRIGKWPEMAPDVDRLPELLESQRAIAASLETRGLPDGGRHGLAASRPVRSPPGRDRLAPPHSDRLGRPGLRRLGCADLVKLRGIGDGASS